MRYHVIVEITYVGGREPLPDHSRASLAAALTEALSAEGREHNFTAADLAMADTPAAYRSRSMVTLSATLQKARPAPGGMTNPLEAMTRFDRSLDRALLASGLFEEFEVSRKVLRVAPVEQVDQMVRRPPDWTAPSWWREP
ncbi:MAG: hypothetical protein ACJ73S_31765 [Mycobacteriales bacterium]